MRREEFAFKSFYEPETNTREREEAVLKIGKELKAVFEDALQYRFDKFEESHLLIWEDLFSWNFTRKERQFLLSAMMEDGEESTTYLSDKISILEEVKEQLEKVESLEDKVSNMLQYDDNGNLLIDNNGYLINSHYYDYGEFPWESLADTLEDYEAKQRELEELKEDLPEYFPENVSSYDCLSFIQYLKAFETYIEEGILPDFIISRIISKLLLLERMQEEEVTKERVVDELFKGLSSEKAKSGWKCLLKKEVVIYNIKSGYLELSKEFKKKYVNRGGGSYYAFIGVFLSGQIKEIELEEEAHNKIRVCYSFIGNKEIFLNQIESVCGVDARNKANECVRSKYQNQNDKFKAPENAFDLYKILQEFEKEYESKNK